MSRAHGTPILAYHAFARPGEREARFVVSPRRFRLQLLLLKLLRRRVIGLDEHVRRLASREPLGRAVVITIDDGYLDNYGVAWPLLRRFGYTATIFLVSGSVGGANDWDPEGDLAGRPLLDWFHIRELAAAGIVFGAHTRTHPSLPGLDEPSLSAEIEGSRRDLEAALDRHVDLFAYPYGRFDDDAVRAVAAAGFSAACTAWVGLAGPEDDPHRLPRVEVRGRESLLRFAARVLGFGEVRT
jgi:peptidoglycan/xylan/chitin deacetylase (PgdA/CDA1 family)